MGRIIISSFIYKLASSIIIAAFMTIEEISTILKDLYAFIDKTPVNGFETATHMKNQTKQPLMLADPNNPEFKRLVSLHPIFQSISQDHAMDAYGKEKYVSVPYITGKILASIFTFMDYKIVVEGEEKYKDLYKNIMNSFSTIWGKDIPNEGYLLNIYGTIQDNLAAKNDILKRISATASLLDNVVVPSMKQTPQQPH